MRSFASRFQLRFNENIEENLILTKNIIYINILYKEQNDLIKNNQF